MARHNNPKQIIPLIKRTPLERKLLILIMLLQVIDITIHFIKK